MQTPSAVTPELAAAYSLCERKAFLTLRGDDACPPHEYVTYLDACAATSMRSFLASLKDRGLTVCKSKGADIEREAEVILEATLKADNLEANVDALIRMRPTVSNPQPLYEPYLFVGTHRLTWDQQIHLGFVEHVLMKAYRYPAETGAVVNAAGDVRHIASPELTDHVIQIIRVLNSWTATLPADPPRIVLNEHCPICPYRTSCLKQAERENNLSLLDRMTPKLLQALRRNPRDCPKG